jgi:glucosamine kinase
MNAKYIIADSGGSSAKWGIVRENNEVDYIRTDSLHPKYALSGNYSFESLRNQFKGINVPLYFYGAGCADEAIQKEMQILLLEFGFSEVRVYPDTLAACRALYGNEPGWVAILGTGSVLVQYDGSQIVKRIGGYGSLIGDEGSGFYFGKLLIRHLLRSEHWKEEWIALFGSKELILSKLADPEAQKWISGLGQETAKLDFGFLHRENAVLFVKLYCLPVPELKHLSFIGTYGHEQKDVFTQVFEDHFIEVKKETASPLKDLVKYHLLNE